MPLYWQVMFALTVPAFPWWEYIRSFTWFMGPVMIAGIAILLAFPIQRRRIALAWSSVGLFQVIFSGFYAYPYSVFVGFPNEVAFGLFVLTSGIILTTVGFIKTRTTKTRLFSLFVFVLGAWELYEFLGFAVMNPNFSVWNMWVNATPYLAFLAAAIVSFLCGIFNLLIKKSSKA